MTPFNKLIIFYFSGTGNAKKAAQWIIEKAKEKSIETELINISHYKFNSKPNFDEKTLILPPMPAQTVVYAKKMPC